MENKEVKGSEKKEDVGFATEFFFMLKHIIIFQWVAMGVLVAIIAAMAFYHEYQWSQFDTVIVDSGDGSGNANYVGNDGDVNNYGKSGSSQEEEIQQEAIKGDKD